MASSAPISPLRRLLEDRLTQLSDEVDALFDEGRERARREVAEQLNQAARRLRQAGDTDELAATLADAAGCFADGCAVFRLEGEQAQGIRIRGVDAGAGDRFQSLRIPLATAAALAGAVETSDPVVAAASASQLSPEMMELAGHAADSRVSIFPVVARGRAAALLYLWGTVQTAGAELLSQVAAAAWTALEPPPMQKATLVQIAEIPASVEEPRGKSWHELPPEEQQAHLRAQRFARVRAAEIRLRQGQAVQAGRSRRDLYSALQPTIDAARQEFQTQFFAGCPSMVDYLHLELLRVLANDNAELLGKDYPGPMV
jgi:hypothetical protein